MRPAGRRNSTGTSYLEVGRFGLNRDEKGNLGIQSPIVFDKLDISANPNALAAGSELVDFWLNPPRTGPIKPEIKNNLGDAKKASYYDSLRVGLGASPWDVIADAARKDGNGSLVYGHDGKGGKTVDILNHGNALIKVGEPIMEEGVRYGALRPGERIRDNAQAGRVIDRTLAAARRASPEEHARVLARLMNDYRLDFGSKELQMAHIRFNAPNEQVYRERVNRDRLLAGLQPLPAPEGRVPDRHEQTVRRMFEGHFRNPEDLVPPTAGNAATGPFGRANGQAPKSPIVSDKRGIDVNPDAPRPGPITPDLKKNLGDAEKASSIGTQRVLRGASPWDVIADAARKDGNGSLVYGHDGKGGKTVDILNHGNALIKVGEPIMEEGVRYGALRPGERIRDNAQAGRVIDRTLAAARRASPEEHARVLARLMNDYRLDFGSKELQMAHIRFNAPNEQVYRERVNRDRLLAGLQPLPAPEGRVPDRHEQTVRRMFEGHFRNPQDLVPQPASRPATGPFGRANGRTI